MKKGYLIFGILCTWLAILNIYLIGYVAHQIPLGIVLLPLGIYWINKGLNEDSEREFKIFKEQNDKEIEYKKIRNKEINKILKTDDWYTFI